jgi:hypothetical protein
VKWFIEGDISQCFDSLDHQVLLAILRESVHDQRFLRLLRLASQMGKVNAFLFPLGWLFEAHTILSLVMQNSIIANLLKAGYLEEWRYQGKVRSSPYPQTRGPEPTRPERKAALGPAHGSAPAQDPGRLPTVP